MSGIIDKLNKMLSVLEDHALRISAIKQPTTDLQSELDILKTQITHLNKAVFDNVSANSRDKSNLIEG